MEIYILYQRSFQIMMDTIIAKEYKLVKKLGSGAFG